MKFQFDFWLLTLALITGAISAFIAIGFVNRIYKAEQGLKKMLLLSFGLTTGTAIWANHILISIALHEGTQKKYLASMFLVAWLLSNLLGVFVLFGASRRNFKLSSLTMCSVIAGLSAFGLYYFNLHAMYDASVLQLHFLPSIASVLFGTCLIATDILALYWVKNYKAKNTMLIKLFAALFISLSILMIHIVYNSSTSLNLEVVSNNAIYTTSKLIGIIAALAFLSFFLLTFIVTLLFEKHGAQMSKLSFLGVNNRKLEAESMEDALTSLPNRRAFEQHLDSLVRHSSRTGSGFALAYIDLDHFKPINDQYGHNVGDIVLQAIAQRLNAAVRECDFIARLGGDEFVAVMEDIKLHEDITPIIERILSSIKKQFKVRDLEMDLSCSIGIAVYPNDGDIHKLIENADAAMYKAKEAGRNQFRYFDAEIETASGQLIELQRELCLAIENKEFFLEFLPKVDCKTQKIASAEALIRWMHPTKGDISPKAFLPAAERFGLINQINDWVLEESCKTIIKAKELGFDLNISINISNQQFRNPNLVDDILDIIKQYDLSTERLSFEIKETLAIKNQAQFKLLLNMFNDAGIKVALDDFGLHPISLAYLQDLNISELKLDRSFVSAINQQKSSKPLISAMIDLAHALNLNVIAEGVETLSQRDALIELNCDQLQGFLISKPIPSENLFKFFQELSAKQIAINFDVPSKFFGGATSKTLN